MTLERGGVHLWYARTERLLTATLLHDSVLMLPPSEVDHWRRLRTWHGRREYLLTRELVRTTLSRYAPVDPRAWRQAAVLDRALEHAAASAIPPVAVLRPVGLQLVIAVHREHLS
jgi:4'-phosphopantetheinyl transferase